MEQASRGLRSSALRFVLLLGVVSLFADVTYEGGRSITGPFLAVLGASAVAVGVVSGVGEFLGYGIRLFAGSAADRTRAYWAFAFLGYAVNLFAVPLLAIAGHWGAAAALVILERIGKGLRTPARDTMLSFAAKDVGRGWGFGIHEALDQVGAIAGPLCVSLALYLGKSYRVGFGVLAIPALVALSFLGVSRALYPGAERPQGREAGLATGEDTASSIAQGRRKATYPKIFWLYLLFVSTGVMGYAHFQLVSFHFKRGLALSDYQIPALFALAMGVDAAVALLVGRAYDRIGLRVLALAPLLGLFIPAFLFLGVIPLVIAGVVLWGAVMGMHETVMRAAVADISPLSTRGQAYGIFNTAYGLSWLVGSSLMSLLYQASPLFLVVFSTLMQVLSMPFLWAMFRLSTGQAGKVAS